MKVFRVVVLLALVSLPLNGAHAHKLILSVYPAGKMIEGEVGFSNGEMADSVTVEISDSDGNQLGQAVTDAEGFFTFEPTKAVRHVFRSDLGAGHIAQGILYEEDLPAHLKPKSSAPAKKPKNNSTSSVSQELSEQLREMIAEEVRREIKPLKKELASYKEKNDFQSILGGLGYILGLFGLAFYLLARRKLKDNQNAD